MRFEGSKRSVLRAGHVHGADEDGGGYELVGWCEDLMMLDMVDMAASRPTYVNLVIAASIWDQRLPRQSMVSICADG